MPQKVVFRNTKLTTKNSVSASDEGKYSEMQEKGGQVMDAGDCWGNMG